MDVDLYDGRTGEWRRRDVPDPLQEEVTLSVWTSPHKPHTKQRHKHGAWTHTVWRRTSQTPSGRTAYAFVGTAPDDLRADGYEYGVPGVTTIPWADLTVCPHCGTDTTARPRR